MAIIEDRDYRPLAYEDDPDDRIPLHQHTVEEVLFVDEGRIEATVGDEQRIVGPGATVFAPARAPHGFRNVGNGVARIHAVFPDTEISIRHLERNPAPGTEGDPPGPPVAFDVRELLEGDPEQAIHLIEVETFTTESDRTGPQPRGRKMMRGSLPPTAATFRSLLRNDSRAEPASLAAWRCAPRARLEQVRLPCPLRRPEIL